MHAFAIGAFGLLRPLFGLSGGDVPRPAPAVPLECRALRDEAAGAPDVSVVIRTWNEAAHLGRTLGMVFGQEGFAGEVIVIDSGSTDATCAIALAHPVRLFGIPKKAFSYGAALNLGARLARGSIVVNLSAHAIPAHRRWLRELTAPLADASIAGVYGRELPIEGWNGHFEAKLLADAFGPLPHRTTANPFFSNANAAMRRQDLLDHPFDEHAGWGEDALWAHAMQAKGMGIAYQPQAAVHHSHNTSMRENFVRCLKHHRTLFAGYLKGREREACAGFYRTLPGRAASFRRFLTADRGMGPLAALLYAPWCEYVNWLGCRIAAEEAREGKR